jgi:NhaA family Na+:H+ antiporter
VRVTTVRRLWTFTIDHSLLLLVGAAAGLVWANIDLGSYERLVHAIHFAINDIGMALFFALAAKEVAKATAPNGALHSPKRAAMPLLAAVGGMVGPALIFVGLAIATARQELLPGCPSVVSQKKSCTSAVAQVRCAACRENVTTSRSC